MTIIDLSQPISPETPVYPGDPNIEVTQQQTIEHDDWNMKRLHINTHDATHVNAPIHASENGKLLDQIDLTKFCGPCLKNVMETGKGCILEGELTQEVFDKILTEEPTFVGFDHSLDNEELPFERKLCEHEIIFYEGLINVDKLPDTFMFYGFPLNIFEGDGSPVRAVAIVS